MTSGLHPLELPHRLPLMVLPDCNLFPHCLLPLHIFEAKYRAMLQAVLGSHRMFCIGTLRPEPLPAAGPFPRLYPSSTAGLVRACVKQPDGCSNLLLQGIQRVRLGAIHDDQPYRVAEITPLAPDPVSAPEEAATLAEVQTAARKLAEAGFPISNHVAHYLENVDRLENLVDIVTYHFITDPHARHPFLEEPSVSVRSRRLIAHLRRQLRALRDDDLSPPD